MSEDVDVVICGAGLAGLALARQLQGRLPGLSIALVDKTRRPLPEACHKVGESMSEIASRYFGVTLGLADYLDGAHLRKLGLRMFFGDGAAPLERRPELGYRRFGPLPTYQVDRGRLEEDLRRLCQESGITLLEGRLIERIRLARRGGRHEVLCRTVPDGRKSRLRARWLIDASGRRRLLQRQLGLGRPNGHRLSAAWFRLKGRVDLDDLVPASRRAWHDRVPGRSRYFSTNHLMGRGYWVWLIGLSSGHTSVGIVADETLHPFRGYSSHAKAMAWLGRREPRLAAFLKRRKPLDFLGLQDCSYDSRQVFSADRWACVGEAGLFADPFYSPGSDYIAVANSMTTELIARDLEGKLTQRLVASYDARFLGLAAVTLDNYRGSYPIWGSTRVMTAKVLWDTALYWAIPCQFFYQGLYTASEPPPGLALLARKYSLLNLRVQQLFRDWAARTPARGRYGFFDLLGDHPRVKRIYAGLKRRKTPAGALRDMAEDLAFFERWAHVLFFQALRETSPDETARFGPRPWINVWAISLDAERWEADGLLRPVTRRSDWRALRKTLEPLLDRA